MKYSNRDKEYDAGFVKLLETAYGDGFLSSGGTKSVDRMFQNQNLDNKRILDIGCGIGGVLSYLGSTAK